MARPLLVVVHTLSIVAHAYHASDRAVLSSSEEPTVALLTQEQAAAPATITYLDEPTSTEYKDTVDLFAARPAGNIKCGSPNKVLATDDWCAQLCTAIQTRANETTELRSSQRTPPQEGMCDPDFCDCFDESISRDDLIKQVKQAERKQPSGLPDCLWIVPEGCSQDSPYECLEGTAAGQCSSENWYGNSECKTSCIHSKALFFSPACEISATCEKWIPGPIADPPKKGEKEAFPRYEHDPAKLTLEKRGIDTKSLHVMMTAQCKKHGNSFVGISLYSPKYKAKAKRLLESCTRNDICCKATEAPDSFGPDAPEGSAAFRYQFIAMKPSFILGQIEATKLPVAWLDSDLEFHRFPTLFAPGGWEDGPRDVAIFNYWGNESNGQGTPSTGSGVVYFNNTERGTAMARAWAEAMAYGTNSEAPDDQVFNELLGPGGWHSRASFGWLPASYLRVVPMFYRGVDTVIDHDHGNPPGLMEGVDVGHSPTKPVLPPTGGPVASPSSGGAVSVDGVQKDPWEVPGAKGHWGDDGQWVSEQVGGAAAEGQAAAAPAAPAEQAAAVASPEQAAPEAPAAPALTCEATSPQADASWCVTSCQENPENDGCKNFCKCEPASSR